MRIILPHKKVNLDTSLHPEDRKVVVENLLKEEIEFHNETMTLEEYLTHTWNKQNSKTIMDLFGYYLTKFETQEVLSRDKTKEMSRGFYGKSDNNRYSNFTDLSPDDKERIGLIDKNEN